MKEEKEIVRVERLLLRALCQGMRMGIDRRKVLRYLENYFFHEPIHLVIFETLREIRVEPPELLRQQMLARLTAKGFPDLDLNDLFEEQALAPGEVTLLMEKLASQSRKQRELDVELL